MVRLARAWHSIDRACRDPRRGVFHVIVEHDHEGIVAKRIDAPYRAGRQSTWVKIKNRAYSSRDAVVWHGRR